MTSKLPETEWNLNSTKPEKIYIISFRFYSNTLLFLFKNIENKGTTFFFLIDEYLFIKSSNFNYVIRHQENVFQVLCFIYIYMTSLIIIRSIFEMFTCA
mgnify:CR=1 FL=1